MSGPSPRAVLDAATPMATPRGWRPLSELQPGDEVFSADGLPCRIVGTWDHSAAAEEAYELRLCDGSVLVCGADQPWLVQANGEAELLATEEIASSLRSGDTPRFSIALPPPLEYRFAELPAEPYEQGARLGSGLLEDAVGIPKSYLQGDVLQRRELLMGLLDEGGGVASDGSVHFDTVHHRLARDVRELVASLGYRVTISSGGGPRGSYKRVSFRTPDQVFGLLSLAERLRSFRSQRIHGFRWLVDVGEMGRRPMRAIEVDAHSHLYVAGEGLLLAPDAAVAASVPVGLQLKIETEDAANVGAS